MARPIKLTTHKILIDAPRELVFQKLSSIGRGKMKDDNNESSRIILRNENSIIAEFRTKAGLLTYTTIEQIELFPPERITFKHLKGPLHYAEEEFIFNDVDGKTELVHNGEFIWHWFPIIGRLAGLLYTKPTFEKVIAKHFEITKVNCEERAARSHVFPRKETASSS